MPTTAHLTLLSRLVREGSWTLEETCSAFERIAQAMGEDATLSVRQLVRWMNGRVGQPRAVSRRVAEQFWGHSFEALLGPAEFTVPAVSSGGTASPTGRNQAQPTAVYDPSAQPDQAPASPGQTLDTFLDVVRLPDGGAAAELVQLSRALDQRSVGRGALTAAELACAHLDHRYAQLGSNNVLPQVRSLLSAVVTHLNEPQPLHHHRRLRILAGRLAGLRAWLCFDLGLDGEAERWYDLAVAAALDAEEWSLAAWLLGGRSLIPSLRHDHRRALALIDRAVAIVNSGADNTTRAWVYALHARGRAGLGDQDGFEGSAAEALTASEHSTEHERRHGMDFVNGSLDLRYYIGTSRLLLHQPARAADMLRGSLHALPTEHTKAHAVLTLNLADVAAQTGEIDEAISLTRSALTSARHQPILPILHQARRIRTLLGTDRASLTADLDDDLHQFAAALTVIAGNAS